MMSTSLTPYTWVRGTFRDTHEALTKGVLPQWFVSGDLVVRRGKRLFAQSFTLKERRYQQYIRKLWRLLNA